MLSFGLISIGESEILAIREDLLECVKSQTLGLVRNLDVDCQGDLVVVTGGCASPDVKKMVTRAISAAEPRFRLRNEIRVCA